MAKLCKWFMRWVRAGAAPWPASSETIDPGSDIGLEAAFAPSSPEDLRKTSVAQTLDTDWAIRRLNSRSNL